MAKLSARKRNEVFRFKKARPDLDGEGCKDAVTWMAFMDDGVVLKKSTWKTWKSYAERWDSASTGWKVVKSYGPRWPEFFPIMKANLLDNGWEVA